MAIKVDWTDEAKETFDANITYLQKEWTEKEIGRFIEQTQKVILRLQQFPESFPPGKRNKNYRRARLNIYCFILSLLQVEESVILLSFWNIKRDPNELKY